MSCIACIVKDADPSLLWQLFEQSGYRGIRKGGGGIEWLFLLFISLISLNRKTKKSPQFDMVAELRI
jgi:hypothetical protein